jgi:mRNA-degrading endonuclease HigB of HigAB toxin-antitoxin module
MKLTIIPADNTVYVDNHAIFDIDLSFVPSNVHALQWKVDLGWIEFVENADFSKPENEIINQLPDWANSAYNAWVTKKAEIEAAAAAAAAAAAVLRQPTTTGTQTL